MRLVVENISKSFAEKNVLKNASMEFEKGKIYALLGRNGAGKTTLMNIISDELNEDSGKVYVKDSNNTLPLNIEDVVYIYSTPILPEFLTGYEFIKYYKDIVISNKKRNGEDYSNIENINIDDIFYKLSFPVEDMYKLITSYSHGMKNKIQMMMCLVNDAPIILLDEPLTSLDVVVSKQIKDILKRIKNERVIIFSTHIL